MQNLKELFICRVNLDFFCVGSSKTRPNNIWQLGPLGWFQVTETKFDFSKVPGDCLRDTKEGLNSQGLARPGTRAAVGPSAASNINITHF